MHTVLRMKYHCNMQEINTTKSNKRPKKARIDIMTKDD